MNNVKDTYRRITNYFCPSCKKAAFVAPPLCCSGPKKTTIHVAIPEEEWNNMSSHVVIKPKLHDERNHFGGTKKR